MTDKPMSPGRLAHIKDQYERWGEAALERACRELIAEIDRLRERAEKAERAEMRLRGAKRQRDEVLAAEEIAAELERLAGEAFKTFNPRISLGEVELLDFLRNHHATIVSALRGVVRLQEEYRQLERDYKYLEES